MRLAAPIAFVLLLPACSQERQKPAEVEYATYEDCLLGKLGRGQSTVASQAIIDACRAKFPVAAPAAMQQPAASAQSDREQGSTPGMFADLLPAGGGDVPDVQADPNWQPPSGPVEFHGYACTEDCSGHEAGYEWAEENGIDDPDDCGGNSDSFIEGCQAYAEEQAENN